MLAFEKLWADEVDGREGVCQADGIAGGVNGSKVEGLELLVAHCRFDLDYKDTMRHRGMRRLAQY